MTLVPYVVEDTGRGERAMDIYSRLLKDRIVLNWSRDHRTASQRGHCTASLPHVGRSQERYSNLH